VSITVVSVMKELGFRLQKEVTWAIGGRVRDIYAKQYGHLPPKELRNKTSGVGTHCFAIYPDNMRSTIEDIIREYKLEVDRQLPFFWES